MFKKVLILSASVGAGHLRAAEAIEKAIKEMMPTKMCGILIYSNTPIRFSADYREKPISRWSAK